MGAVVLLLELRGRNTAQELQDALRVEPRHPFKRRMLDVLETAPRPTTMDHLRLVQSNDRLGEGVIVRIARTADGRRRVQFQTVRLTGESTTRNQLSALTTRRTARRLRWCWWPAGPASAACVGH